MGRNVIKDSFSLKLLPVITVYLLFLSSKTVCDVAWSELEFFELATKGLCQKNESKVTLVNVKVPDIQSLQPFVRVLFLINRYQVKGIWALHTGVNYTGLASLVAPFECAHLSHGFAGMNSFRYLGNPDYNQPGLSLLAGDEFYHRYNGKEDYYENSVENIMPASCASYWVTSGRENWTIYSGPNFTGESACIGPYDGKSFGWGVLGHYLNVSSVRRGGCFSKNVFSPDENTHKSKDGEVFTSRYDFSPRPTRRLSLDRDDNKGWESCRHSVEIASGIGSFIQAQFWTILIISVFSVSALFTQNIWGY